MPRAVRVGGEDVHEAVVEHLLAEVLRVLAEAAGEAARGDLHPRAAAHQRGEHRVVLRIHVRRSGCVITGTKPAATKSNTDSAKRGGATVCGGSSRK